MRQYMVTLTNSDSDYTMVRQTLATIGHRMLLRSTLRTIEFEVQPTNGNEKPIFVAHAIMQALLDNRFVDMVQFRDDALGDDDYRTMTVGGGISPNIRDRIGSATPNYNPEARKWGFSE